MKNSLSVSEQFGVTLQGEGITMGMPSYFLRLSKCTLSCGFIYKDGKYIEDENAKWKCDSISSWQFGVHKNFEQVIKDYGSDFISNISKTWNTQR